MSRRPLPVAPSPISIVVAEDDDGAPLPPPPIDSAAVGGRFPAEWRRVHCGAASLVVEGTIASVPVIPSYELFDPAIGLVTIRGAVVARTRGRIRAFANICRHIPLALDLGDGDVASADRTHFLCNHHGARYRLDDGRCESGPCDGDALFPLGVEIVDGELILAIPPLPAPPKIPG